ncbi:MAG: hypothetical protein JXA81_01120 [Sedimentisphaerales bacterium]|nr:hypothetical protein [Sedimentisphaerales bacterium]
MTTDERMEKMEGQLACVRWFNRILIFSIVLFLGIWLILKSFGPETAWAQSSVEEIRAKKFVLEDENGKIRATLAMTENGPMLSLSDENGKTRAAMRVAEGKPSLSLHDVNGKERASLMVGTLGPYLTLYDENDKLRADLSVGKDSSSLSLSDENGKERAVIGMFDEPDLFLFDENGEIIWAAL